MNFDIQKSYEEFKRLYPNLAQICSYDRFVTILHRRFKTRIDAGNFFLTAWEVERSFDFVIDDFL
jgi:hypothetical protein